MDIDKLQISIEATSKQAESEIDVLISKLGSLSSTLSSIKVPTGFTSFVNGISNLKNALNGINTTGLEAAAYAMSAFSSSTNGSVSSSAKVRDMASSINRLSEVAPKLAETLPNASKAITEFIEALNAAPELSANISNLADNMSRLSISMSNIRTPVVLNNGGSGGLASRIGDITHWAYRLRLTVLMLKKAFDLLKKPIKEAMDYGETVNLFDTVFESVGRNQAERIAKDNAQAYTESFFANMEDEFREDAQEFNDWFVDNLTLDPNEIMNYQAKFAQMADSMGTIPQTTMNISKAFTALGADIASLFNIDIKDAMSKLQSGLAGQIRPLRAIGVDISKTSLMQTAWNYGIDKSIEKMTSAEKVQLRFLTTMRQLRVVMADMPKTLETPANQLRVLQQQFKNLARAVGSIFIPVAMKVLPVLNAIVIVLTRIANAIAKFFGFELPKTERLPVNDYFTDIEDDVDSASEEVKKFQKQLLGFDEINNITESKDSGLGGLMDNDGFDSLDKAIADEWAAYQKLLQDAMDAMSNKAKELADKWEEPIKRILTLITAIGAGFLAWKIANGILDFFGAKSIKDFKTLADYVGQLGVGFNKWVIKAAIPLTIAVMVARFVQLCIQSENFRNGLSILWDVFSSVFGFIGDVLKFVADLFKPVIDGVLNLLDGVMALSSDGFELLSVTLKDTNPLLSGILEFISQMIEGIRNLDIDFADFAITLAAFTIGGPIGWALGMFELVTVGIRALGAAFKDESKSVDIFGKGISKSTKEVLEPFIDQVMDLSGILDQVELGSLEMDESTIETIKYQVSDLKNYILNNLDTSRDEALGGLSLLEGYVDEDQLALYKEQTNTFYNDLQTDIAAGEARINEILETFGDLDAEGQKAAMDEINQIKETMTNKGIQIMTKSSEEFQLIQERLNHNLGVLNLEQASEYIKQALTTRDEAIAAAEEQYDGILLNAMRLKEAGIISDEEYQGMIDDAQIAKDKEIGIAESKYDELCDSVTTGLGNMKTRIDTETGEVLSNWDIFCNGLWENFNKFIGWIIDKGNELKEWCSSVGKFFGDIGDKVNKVGDFISGAFDKLTGKTKETETNVGYSTGIISGFLQNLCGKADELGVKAGTLSANVQASANEMAAGTKTSFGSVSNDYEKLSKKTDELATFLTDDLLTAVDVSFTQMTDASGLSTNKTAGNVDTFISTTRTKLDGFVADTQAAFSTWCDTITSKVSETATNVSTNLIALFQNTTLNVQTLFMSLSEQFIVWFQENWNQFVEWSTNTQGTMDEWSLGINVIIDQWILLLTQKIDKWKLDTEKKAQLMSKTLLDILSKWSTASAHQISLWFTNFNIAYTVWDTGLKTSWMALWQGMTDFLTDCLNASTAGFERYVNNIIDGLNQLISQFNALASEAQFLEWLGVPIRQVGYLSGVSVGRIERAVIPAFANGALVSAPTLAMVGDNRNAYRDPEVISPLSKLQGLINTNSNNSEIVSYLKEMIMVLYEISQKENPILNVEEFVDYVENETQARRALKGDSAFNFD